MSVDLNLIILGKQVQSRVSYDEEFFINPTAIPGLQVGQIIEVHNQEANFPRLLLCVQSSSLRTDHRADSISILHSIVDTFHLRDRLYLKVSVAVVKRDAVTLDSVELYFTGQYLNRSDMWRLKNSMCDHVVYLKKVVYFFGHAVACHVFEMWANGDRVSAGLVTAETKVVFRSKTSMFHIYIQMSDEMWDYDVHGDLYFEKAVNGFLAGLFASWRRHNTNHEVTIALFSRVFYHVRSAADVPDYMTAELCTDGDGGVYEDFYRVVVQSERRDDWSPLLEQIRRLFTGYRESLLQFQRRRAAANGWRSPPRAYLSSAAAGNFLEVLNVSMNVYEKHGLHRSLERTGQMCVVVSPGVGVFHVRRALNNLTKQRIIDYGVGIDLVCVGEQPLHAVPLLKFHTRTHSDVPDYYLPHTWINLSFFASDKRVGYTDFVPRIKVPPRDCCTSKSASISTAATAVVGGGEESNGSSQPTRLEASLPSALFDFDAYDNDVFALPDAATAAAISARHSLAQHRFATSTSASSTAMTMSLKRQLPRARSSTASRVPFTSSTSTLTSPVDRHSSDDFDAVGAMFGRSSATPLDDESRQPTDASLERTDGRQLTDAAIGGRIGCVSFDDSHVERCRRRALSAAAAVVSASVCDLSLTERSRPGRALFNPFDPRNIVVKHTSNRRRWSHIFPRGPGGVPFQQHHFDVNGQLEAAASTATRSSFDASRTSRPTATAASPSLAFLWGASASYGGENEWSANVITGVDWKSLTMPACLPITTDYHPHALMLDKDHLVHQYSVLADEDAASGGGGAMSSWRPSSAAEIQRQEEAARRVFDEMVSQRLCQGFQLIVASSMAVPAPSTCRGLQQHPSSSPAPPPPPASNAASHYYLLSIGRIFHSLALSGGCVLVTHYRPRYPYRVRSHQHRYWLRGRHHGEYCSCRVVFSTDSPEDYNWNHLDNYVCSRGGRDFPLTSGLKFWRCRLILISQRLMTATASCASGGSGSHSSEGSVSSTSCDSAGTTASIVEYRQAVDDFVRFVSSTILAGRLKRPLASWAHRERGATAGAIDRVRTRSGSSTAVAAAAKTRHESARASVTSTTSSTSSTGSHSNEDVSHKTAAGSADGAVSSSPSAATAAALSVDSSPAELFAAMRAPDSGVPFVARAVHCDLPDLTFVSVELVQWTMQRVLGARSEPGAVGFCERLRRAGLLVHASGDERQPFVCGTYLFCLRDPSDASTAAASLTSFGVSSGGDQFRAEWMQVEARLSRPSVPSVMCPSSTTTASSGDISDAQRLGECYINLDAGGVSDRPEWGQLVYERSFRPDRAYEMSIHWLVGSGGVLSELVGGWQRRADNCGFRLVQVPALVCSSDGLNADPFRVPVRVRVDVSALRLPASAVATDATQTKHVFAGADRSSSSNDDADNDEVLEMEETDADRLKHDGRFESDTGAMFPPAAAGESLGQLRRHLLLLLQCAVLERLQMVRLCSLEHRLPWEFVHNNGHCFAQIPEAQWRSAAPPDTRTDSAEILSVDEELVSAEFLWYSNVLLSRRDRVVRGADKQVHNEAASVLETLTNTSNNTDGCLTRMWRQVVATWENGRFRNDSEIGGVYSGDQPANVENDSSQCGQQHL